MTAKTGALKTPTGAENKEWQCLTCQYVVSARRCRTSARAAAHRA